MIILPQGISLCSFSGVSVNIVCETTLVVDLDLGNRVFKDGASTEQNDDYALV